MIYLFPNLRSDWDGSDVLLYFHKRITDKDPYWRRRGNRGLKNKYKKYTSLFFANNHFWEFFQSSRLAACTRWRCRGSQSTTATWGQGRWWDTFLKLKIALNFTICKNAIDFFLFVVAEPDQPMARPRPGIPKIIRKCAFFSTKVCQNLQVYNSVRRFMTALNRDPSDKSRLATSAGNHLPSCPTTP